jgi:replicative DNA helicase
MAQYLYEQMSRMQRQAGRLSGAAIIAMLPEDCGGVTRGQFFARIASAGMSANNIPALIVTLKDRWARRQLAHVGATLQAEATRPGVDPFETAASAMSAIDPLNAARSNEKPGGFLAGAADTVISRLDAHEKLRGAPTGLRSLDMKLNGYQPGQLYVFGGRPGMGKSAIMVSSLRRTAEAGYGVAIISLEMVREEIAARAMSDMCGSPRAPGFGAILKGAVSESDKAALRVQAEKFASSPIWVDDSPRLTFPEIASRARALKSKMALAGIPLAVLCIDHMGLVTPSNRYSGNKVAEAGEVSGQARALAKELGCCVLLLCQLSREVEKRDDKRPVMSDLRWSGEIEQDAHVIGFLYRESYYLEQNEHADPVMVADARNRLDFLIRKNRNGETGDVRLWCSIAHSSIRDN